MGQLAALKKNLQHEVYRLQMEWDILEAASIVIIKGRELIWINCQIVKKSK